jgi:hypothetical protein
MVISILYRALETDMSRPGFEPRPPSKELFEQLINKYLKGGR